MILDETLRDKIKKENLRIHAIEGLNYKKIHPESYNFYQIQKVRQTLRQVEKSLPESARVLDLGCGHGRFSLELAGRGYSQTCVDMSEEMLGGFRNSLPGGQPPPGMDIICDDAVSFLGRCPKDSRFDLIIMSAFLHHLPSVEEPLELAANLLAKGGFLLVFEEPIKQPIRSKMLFKLHRLFGSIDERLYRLRLKRQGIGLESVDYEYSDFQRTIGGIEPERICRVLERSGLVIKSVDRYSVRRFGIVALVVNGLLGTANTFNVLAGKP